MDEWTNEPRLQFFSSCVQAIAQLPTIPLDKNNPEDVDTTFKHDHIYDALRYGLQSRPRSSLFDFDEEFSRAEYVPSDPTMGY